jgi:3-hydroxyacyl-CoA dehydrogenase / enoyl-CoA hydratase / 3-hydroxybutyryl-CoA epimerase
MNTVKNTYANFRLDRLLSGVIVLYLDVPGKVNVLKMVVMEEIDRLCKELAGDPDFQGLIITSAKPNMFIAGADVSEIDGLQKLSQIEAFNVTERGKAILRQLRTLGRPSVALIDGPCLGGGMELAMWCNFRLITTNPKACVGQPEVKLGAIPGFGGCVLAQQLMPDPIAAVEFVAKGGEVAAADAWQSGLVDEVVSGSWEELIRAAEAVALTGRVKRCQKPRASLLQSAKAVTARARSLLNAKDRSQFLLDTSTAALLKAGAAGRRVLTGKVIGTVKQKGKGYVAPALAAEVVMRSMDMPFDAALTLESQLFARATSSWQSANLVDLFLWKSDAKKPPQGAVAAELKLVGVAGGAGTMGKEFGFLLALSDAIEKVVLVDVDMKFFDKALSDISKLFDYQLKKGVLTPEEKAAKLSKIVATTDYGEFADCDAIIEAVRESDDEKIETYRKIDAAKANATKPYYIFSNTSARSLTKLAAGTAHPEWFGGFHGFNPPSLMPLVEVPRARQTDDTTHATALKLVSLMGKIPLPCLDSTGFVVNRILGPELVMVAWLLAMGVPPKDIDKAMLDWGFPMGPVTLLDQVGLDIVASVAKSLYEAYGERMALPPSDRSVLDKLCFLGQLGKKTGQGIYIWQGDKPVFNAKERCNLVNPVLIEAFPALGKNPMGKESIQRLLSGVMQMEAVRVLEEGVVAAPWLVDLGMVFGAGFAPFRGGPIKAIDRQGIGAFCDSCEMIASAGPESWRLNFAPGALLKEHYRTRECFYQE